jgi:DNA-binding MarR family transcriptional regulator
MKQRTHDIFKASDELKDLKLLEEIEKNPNISQRELSQKFGIALGVINGSLKAMARKGWIQFKGFNHRRIEYYLTPNGFLEKSKLRLTLVSGIIQHYTELKQVINERLLEMERRGIRRIVFYGISNEMEVAYITLQGGNLKLVGIVEDDEKSRPQIVFDYEVEPVSRVMEFKPDCILITTLTECEQKKERIQKIIGLQSVFVRDICLS